MNMPGNSPDFSSLALLQLSVMRAFIGKVSQNLAGILAVIVSPQIQLCVYFFEEPSDEDRVNVEVAETEIIADYPDSYSVETSCYLISNLDHLNRPWVFLRAEAERPTVRARANGQK
jgi:hypothetical protein